MLVGREIITSSHHGATCTPRVGWQKRRVRTVGRSQGFSDLVLSTPFESQNPKRQTFALVISGALSSPSPSPAFGSDVNMSSACGEWSGNLVDHPSGSCFGLFKEIGN